jgi:alanine dehydrogenase
MESGCTAIAYETVTADDGTLPLLTPMSQVAGRLSALVAARFLTVHQGGRGVLFSGMPGVAPAKVVILGAGNVGEQAAVMSMGMGAQVVVMDRSVPRLQHLERHYGGRLQTVFASRTTIEHHIRDAHVVIGAVLVPGAEAPKVLHREQLSMMKKGAVLVDVAIDQGGCFETSRETTHEDPVYEVDGIVHYCVPNMPGGVARTSTTALSNTTLPVIEKLASMGWREALRSDPHLMNGLNVHRGMVTCKAVADAHGFPYVDPLEALEKSP